MYRGKVTAVDAGGVYVQTAEFGVIGPCQAVVANYAAGDMVLLSDVGSDAAPDLVVVGKLTATGNSAHPATSTDNTVARYDGTGGALQGSGVTIDDAGNVTGVAGLSVSKAAYAGLLVSSNAGTGPYIQLATGGVGRWDFFRNDESESGSNAGSNLQINRLSDAGGLIGTPIKITRSTGKITLGDVGTAAGIEFGSSGPRIMVGTGSPESVVTAPVGSLWLRTNGGASTTLYVKESGTGNTGWIAK